MASISISNIKLKVPSPSPSPQSRPPSPQVSSPQENKTNTNNLKQIVRPSWIAHCCQSEASSGNCSRSKVLMTLAADSSEIIARALSSFEFRIVVWNSLMLLSSNFLAGSFPSRHILITFLPFRTWVTRNQRNLTLHKWPLVDLCGYWTNY